jgi:hypothetical protein
MLTEGAEVTDTIEALTAATELRAGHRDHEKIPHSVISTVHQRLSRSPCLLAEGAFYRVADDVAASDDAVEIERLLTAALRSAACLS